MTEQALRTAQESDAYEEAPAGEEKLVVILKILTQLAYRKGLIAAVTVIFALICLVLCFSIPVRYTAETVIMTPQQAPSAASMVMNQLSASGNGSLALLAGGGGGLLKNPNDIYVGLLKTRPVADAIIQRFGLDKWYHSKDHTAAIQKLAKKTTVTSGREGFITVSYTDTDRKLAADVANAYTSELGNLMKTLAVTEASRRRLFYEQQLKESKESLVAAELAFEQVQQQKGLVQPEAQAKVMIESLAAIQAQIVAKQVQIESLRTFSTENNPELQLVEQQLSALKDQASRMEKQGHNKVGFGDFGLADVPAAGLDYLRAEHELRYRQALFDLLLKQYDAARLDEAKEAAIIQIVEPAIPPERKSFPKRTEWMLWSVFLGLFSGCMLSIFLWKWKGVLSNPDVALRAAELRAGIRGVHPAKLNV